MFRNYLHTWDSSHTISQVWSSKASVILELYSDDILNPDFSKSQPRFIVKCDAFFFSVSAETIPVILHRHRMPSGMWVTVHIRFMEVKWTAVIKRQSDCSLKCSGWFNVIGTYYIISNTTVMKSIRWGGNFWESVMNISTLEAALMTSLEVSIKQHNH